MIEIDPADNQIRVEHAQEIIDEAYSSPIEGARKAIIVFEAERLNEAAANKLLKTLEEPPASALLVLVTAGADQLLPTILSRCQRVDFAYLAPGTVERVLDDGGRLPGTRRSGRAACGRTPRSCHARSTVGSPACVTRSCLLLARSTAREARSRPTSRWYMKRCRER